MLENTSKYWPLLTVGALAIVSIFNIGYFSVIGLHFLGVMDLSNMVYAVGLVVGLVIAPLLMFPHNWVELLREVASRSDAPRRLDRMMKIFTFVLMVCFAVGLFVHQPFISIVGLFAVTFSVGFLAFSAYYYAMWRHFGVMPLRSAFAGGAFGIWTLLWVGGAVAYHEAFGSKTLYNLTTKDAELKNVRLVRSSSSGFIIAQEKKIMYVPAGELKSIVLVEAVP
jgi:hypothetical protein